MIDLSLHTPQSIAALYHKHGKKPCGLSVVNTGESCCGAGILMLEDGKVMANDLAGRQIWLAVPESVHEDMNQFIEGFDAGWFQTPLRQLGPGRKLRQLGYDTAELARYQMEGKV